MTNSPPIEIRSLIENHINAFNAQNNEHFSSLFAHDAVIVDGIAPYRWLNPDAPSKWLADVEKWREHFGVTYERLSYEMGFWNVEGSYAYAVIRGNLTVTMRRNDIIRTGTLAYTFSKDFEEWKITAQAWGRTS